MRLEVCGGESCKGTVDSRCPGGRGGGGATRHGGVGNTCTFGREWGEEREWEVHGRRGSGRSLVGGEGVGGPWEEEREWEVLGRMIGSGGSLYSQPHTCSHTVCGPLHALTGLLLCGTI